MSEPVITCLATVTEVGGEPALGHEIRLDLGDPYKGHSIAIPATLESARWAGARLFQKVRLTIGLAEDTLRL